MTSTRRVGGFASAGNTKRIATTGAVPGTAVVFGGDRWGGTWGNTWGKTWFVATPGANPIPESPAIDVTRYLPGKDEPGHPTPVSAFKIESGTYKGHFKYLGPLSGINQYFVFAGMALSERFASQDILAAADIALRLCVVAERSNSSNYAVQHQLIVLDQKVFFLNTPGISNTAPPSTDGINGPGQFLYENEGVENFAIWESTKITLPGGGTTNTFPSSWSWFLADISASLVPFGSDLLQGILAPDSTDAFTGVLISAIAKANPQAAWLNAASGIPKYSRIDLIAKLALENITNEIDPTSGLVYTFQGATAPDGNSYNISFLADNVEVYSGLLSLASLHTIVGDTAAASAASSAAATLKANILALYDADVGRFRTYYGQADHGSLTGNSAFVTDFRFHLWPAVYDILTTDEVATYRDGVVGYTIENTPDIFDSLQDDFPLSEWYWAVSLSNLEYARLARDELIRRIDDRATNRRTLMDLALGGDIDALARPFVATRRLGGEAVIDVTRRIGSAASHNITKRVNIA